jgi:hypothetical protein
MPGKGAAARPAPFLERFLARVRAVLAKPWLAWGDHGGLPLVYP